MRLFILGPGYSVRHTLPFLAGTASRISGTARRPEARERLLRLGVTPIGLDGDALAAEAGAASHLLIGAGPGTDGDPFLTGFGEALDRAAAGGGLQSIVYLSTIGVYGDAGGARVDETAEVGTSARAQLRLRAEGGWREFGARHGVPVAILRLGGIYGPARNPLVMLKAGTARRIVRAGQVFNRIHVTDIGAAIAATLDRRYSGIVNVTDGHPTAPEEPVEFAADLMGIAPPAAEPFETAALSPMAAAFWADNRQVGNDRLRHDLGVALRFPTYRDGLAALWHGGTWAGDADDRDDQSPRFRKAAS